MKMQIFTLSAVLLSLLGFCHTVVIQDLGGSSWTAISSNKSIKVSSHVPGSIYSDLERAKIIEPIYKDFNDVKLRWVSYDSWTFERTFDFSPELLNKTHIFLTAHGLDTVATISLNGQELGKVDNMFIRYRFLLKSIGNPKNNSIQIKFESAPILAKKLQDKITKEQYPIAPTSLPVEQNGENHVQMLRTMQASFSWDWGPAFPTQGIWQPLTFEAFDNQVIRTISVETQTTDHKQWTLAYKVNFEGVPSSDLSSGKLSLFLDGTLIEEQKISGLKFDKNGEVSSGHSVKVPEKLAVKAWFPNGVGDQKLYKLSVKFEPDHEKGEITEKSIKIGFRTVQVIEDKLQSKAEAYSFYFKVNDLSIFVKGSNWIPAHVLPELLTEQYIRDLLHSAKLANMNMLRVWGGGVYESDKFYEIADEYGIMIWQDMMFACATYPTDEGFLGSVRTEIRQQIRRLQHHPSIALWAGNNENEAALYDGWWSETRTDLHHKDYQRDYRTLYLSTIGPIIESEDHSRPYLPSSPSNGKKGKEQNYFVDSPSDLKSGDVHFYITDGDVWDWKTFPSAKFASEYGFQSWASIQTLKQSISEEHFKYPIEEGLQHREHKPSGNEDMAKMASQNLILPSGKGNVSKLVDYIYITQVWQSMAIKAESEFYRRNRFVDDYGNGNTMGALYWQLNDIWPTVSWASVEFGGKWKILHYFAEDFFQNLLVVPYIDNGQLKVDIVRDDHTGVEKFDIQIDVFDWSKLAPIHQHKVPSISTSQFSVTHGFNENLDKFLQESGCKAAANCFVEVSLVQSGEIKSKNFLFVDQPKNAVGLQKPNIKIQISEPKQDSASGEQVFTVNLETDHLAPFVWLDFVPESTIQGRFSDNGFMFTSPKVTITFRTQAKVTMEKLKQELVVKSLKEIS